MDMGKEMTPRQRWIALFEGKKTDCIPTDFWATYELIEMLKLDLGCTDESALVRRLHADKPRVFGPRWKIAHHPHDPEADPWGLRHQQVDYGTGHYDEFASRPLAHMTQASEIHAYRWPEPDDLDYSGIGDALDRDDGTYPIQAGYYEPFLLYAHMRGLEQAYMDFYLYPDIVEAALGHMFDFLYEQNRRTFEAARRRVDIFYLAEDLGGQHGPLFDLETYRRFIRPHQIKMAELARSHGIHIFYHTDGAARPFLHDLVDVVGIEILNPIQHRCPGMNRRELVREFGDRVIFHGAIENQQVLPFGTPEQVRREVMECAEDFANARWICASCHFMQANTPTENVLALYETIQSIAR